MRRARAGRQKAGGLGLAADAASPSREDKSGWTRAGRQCGEPEQGGLRADCGWIAGGLRVDCGLIVGCGLVFGVFALAFCVLDSGRKKAKAKAPSREESGGLWVDCGWIAGGLRVDCGWIVGGLRVDCGIFALCCVHFGSVLCSFSLCVVFIFALCFCLFFNIH